MPCPVFSLASYEDATPLLSMLHLRNQQAAQQEGANTVEQRVSAILEDVRLRGLQAVVDYTRQFDAPNFCEHQFRIDPEELAAAAQRSDLQSQYRVIATAIEHIRAFHQHQKASSWFVTHADGSLLGQHIVPVDRAGIYVPGGKGGSTPLISSLLMGAIPAQVAGVQSIAVISPPGADGCSNPLILGTAHLLGITEVYAAGSAWGIAALAHGAGPLAPVDIIAGPGNIYVATAKRLLHGRVAIDMLAGPSEVLILADQGANPAWLAADMLAQAEHDPQASAICLCTSEDLAHKVLAALKEQLEATDNPLPRKDIAAQSLARFGAVGIIPDLRTGVSIANHMAPEHLELMVAAPWELVPHIRHAGAIFMGYYAAESLGDYYAGPNHVLPTMGTARFSSALGVDTFYKKISLIAPSIDFARQSAQATADFARMEALEAHARSALCRK